MVDPNLGLQAASGLVSFLLKTAVESLVCVAVVRLAGSARWRFNVWLGMLLTFAAQWTWMWLQIARAAWPMTTVSSTGIAALPAIAARRIAVARPTAGWLAGAMVAVAIVYVAVLVWRGFAAFVARRRLARALRHARMPGERLMQAFTYVLGDAQAAGVEFYRCELRVLPGIASPATVGWRRPVVIVPPLCELRDGDELAAIFWHELKHVQRRDAFWNALAEWCSALLWFHPAVHHAAAQMRVQRELACDADVIREHPQARDVYASCLLQFARTAGAGNRVAAIEMASAPALLTRRVRSILAEKPQSSGWSLAGRAVANAGLVVITVTVMPHVNVLFAEQASEFVLQSPAQVFAAPQQRAIASHARRRMQRQQETPTPSDFPSTPIAAATTPAVLHDDALAAEHRVALNVLTESTGIEPSAASDRTTDNATNPASHAGSHVSVTSWGKIAVDAAERMGPLMTDRDGDRHMH